jgi:hypothetical protein
LPGLSASGLASAVAATQLCRECGEREFGDG